MTYTSPYIRAVNPDDPPSAGYDYGLVVANPVNRRRDTLQPLGQAATFDDARAAMIGLGFEIPEPKRIAPPTRRLA